MLLPHGEVALKDLAPALFVSEGRRDPAQPPRDHVILLLEALESAVDLVEVAEHLTPEFGNPVLDLGDLAAHLVKPATDFRESAIDLGEAESQELDELLVLGGRHGP